MCDAARAQLRGLDLAVRMIRERRRRGETRVNYGNENERARYWLRALIAIA